MKKILLLFVLLPFTGLSGSDSHIINPRSAAMGHSSVTFQDSWSAAGNQAGMAWLSHPQFSVFYRNKYLLRETGTAAAIFVLPFNKSAAGLTYIQTGYHLFTQYKTGLSYAMRLNEKISASVQINYQQLRFGDVYGRKHAVTGEAGFQVKLNSHLWIGVHLFNPGRSKITDIPLEYIPTIFRAGGTYHFSGKFFIATETRKDIDNPMVFSGGAEYQIHPAVSIRTGFKTNPFVQSFGFGVKHKNLVMDFAAGFHQLLGFSSQVGFSIEFK